MLGDSNMKRPDRRQPSSSVYDLRRQLLDADQERFYLQAAVNTAADQWLSSEPQHFLVRRSRKIARVAFTAGVLILLGGIAWERLDISRPSDDGRTAGAAPSPADVQLAERTDLPSRENIPPRRRLASSTGPKTGVRRSNSRPVIPERIDATRAKTAPRPLSPGEFGRTPSRQRP